MIYNTCERCGEVCLKGYLYNRGSSTLLTNSNLNISEAHLVYVYFQNPFTENSDKSIHSDRWLNIHLGEITAVKPAESKLANYKEVTLKIFEDSGDLDTFDCPACEESYRQRPNGPKSPIRNMGTGYHKIRQLITEQIIRFSPNVDDGKNKKLIVFSDSRRDASLVSAELERNHISDTIRAFVEEFLAAKSSNTRECFENYIKLAEAAQLNDSEEIEEELEDHPFTKIDNKAANQLGRWIRKGKPNIETGKNYKSLEPYLSGDRFSQVFIKDILLYLESSFKKLGFYPVLKDHFKKPWSLILSTSTARENESKRQDFSKTIITQVRKILTEGLFRDIESLGLGWFTLSYA